MESLRTLTGIATLEDERTRNELEKLPEHCRERLGVKHKKSKDFIEACENDESYAVLKWLFDPELLDAGSIKAAENGHENIVILCKRMGRYQF